MFDNLTIADAEMPTTARGRTAEPIPAALLDAVKASHNGIGKATRIEKSGEANKHGEDTNLVAFRTMLRRCAKELGLGLSIATGKETSKTVEVLFQAKDFTPRPRKAKDDAQTASEVTA